MPSVKNSLSQKKQVFYRDKNGIAPQHNTMPTDSPICGLWIDDHGQAQLSVATTNGERETLKTPFEPFFWSARVPDGAQDVASIETLEGTGAFTYLMRFEHLEDYTRVLSEARKAKHFVETVRPLEHQFLLHNQKRLFENMRFSDLRRCQLDIETACSVEGGFSNPRRKDDRILAIGLRLNGETTLLHLEDNTDKAERELLKKLNTYFLEKDPDIIEGHNIFKFDLEYLRRRCQRFRLPCAWGRFGAEAKFRNSRLRVAERWLDFPRCDLPGRTVVDTFFLVMMFDISKRDLPAYSLKEVALYFGVSQSEDRTYLKGDAIQKQFYEDRTSFDAYLTDDVRETAGIADILLPTYIAQASNFAMNLQEIVLRGTGTKIDSLFLEKYYHAKASLPLSESVAHYAGGFTKSFEEGIHRHVLHFDVASLYPSLLLLIGRNPHNDRLGVFMPLLKQLREYRLDYKKRARETDDPELRREYDARQASFKIIINSFYGYLGFEGARFADGELAAEVTERGRELLQNLIEKFQQIGCCVLEADTDGIYLSSEAHFDKPEALLGLVNDVLPEGIELEYDGKYPAMFCYKAKNYALYDGEHVTIRGSALRSRGTEPFLKDLTDTLIHFLLGASQTRPEEKIAELQAAINAGDMDIHQLAKKEYLSQSPEKYRESMEKGGKPRRASLEAALRLDRPLKSGDQVAYYITHGEKKRCPDWQVARPVEHYDASEQPYNPDYYLKKLKDWEKRYAEFLKTPEEQGELF